jgi:predicted nucleic acid-binding protein
MIFIDTNIFVYAHDESDPFKAQKARALLVELINNQEGRISTQVVQEFCNVALKKAKLPLKARDLRTILREIMIPMLAHRPDASFYIRAIETHEKYSLSFYDALIVQAARDLNCTALYSEDLQTGARYGKVKVVNPFA